MTNWFYEYLKRYFQFMNVFFWLSLLYFIIPLLYLNLSRVSYCTGIIPNTLFYMASYDMVSAYLLNIMSCIYTHFFLYHNIWSSFLSSHIFTRAWFSLYVLNLEVLYHLYKSLIVRLVSPPNNFSQTPPCRINLYFLTLYSYFNMITITVYYLYIHLSVLLEYVTLRDKDHTIKKTLFLFIHDCFESNVNDF